MSKRVKFEYKPIDDELSTSTAFLQAAAALDMAVNLAVQSADIEQLSNLSVLWMEIASRLANGGFPVDHQEAHDDEEEEESRPIGFTADLGNE